MAFDFIAGQLAQQAQVARYRQRTLVDELDGRLISIGGKTYLNFSANDYLGLNHHPKINQALQQGVDRFGSCATGSSLLTGFHYAHQALEESICQWLNKPRCLLFASGFAANNAVLQALGQQDCYFWLDKLAHASLIDGALSSQAKVKRFLHNDTEQLNRYLSKTDSSNQLVVSEGVFSMDGDSAPLVELEQTTEAHRAWLYLDDAHSIGVIGKQGQGSSSEIAPDIIMATFGKALATSGAMIACDENLYQYLINFARHYIYSTAISPAMAWATKTAIELAQQEQWRRDKIVELSTTFRQALADDIELLPTDSSIHAIIVGSEEKTLAAAKALKDRSIWLSAIRPPTVPRGKSRLRVTVCANHNVNDINELAKKINEVLT